MVMELQVLRSRPEAAYMVSSQEGKLSKQAYEQLLDYLYFLETLNCYIYICISLLMVWWNEKPTVIKMFFSNVTKHIDDGNGGTTCTVYTTVSEILWSKIHKKRQKYNQLVF